LKAVFLLLSALHGH